MQVLLRKSDYTGRIAKWGTKLGAYDVRYMPWTAVKGQVLANFVAEFTEGVLEEEKAVMGVLVMLAAVVPSCKVYTDEASIRKEGRSRDCVGHPREADNGEIVTIGILGHQQ